MKLTETQGNLSQRFPVPIMMMKGGNNTHTRLGRLGGPPWPPASAAGAPIELSPSVASRKHEPADNCEDWLSRSTEE
jgi:hypothetical protein